jgi:nuclear transport factor 2 (NTF2) superfamily protein
MFKPSLPSFSQDAAIQKSGLAEVCGKLDDVPTASRLEWYTDAAEKRPWFLSEAARPPWSSSDALRQKIVLQQDAWLRRSQMRAGLQE